MIEFIKPTGWTLAIVLVLFEFSPYISTKHIIKKLAILLMACCALGLAYKSQIHNDGLLLPPSLVLIFLLALLAYFATCTIRSYLRAIQNTKNRRATD